MGYKKSESKLNMIKGNISFFSVIILIVLLLFGATGLTVCGPFIAGQGDAPRDVELWIERNIPEPVLNLECQPRDTNEDGYVACTVSTATRVIPLECGVNRWYHGCNNAGCKIQRGIGAQ